MITQGWSDNNATGSFGSVRTGKSVLVTFGEGSQNVHGHLSKRSTEPVAVLFNRTSGDISEAGPNYADPTAVVINNVSPNVMMSRHVLPTFRS